MTLFFSLIVIIPGLALVYLFSKQAVGLKRGEIVAKGNSAAAHLLIEPIVDYLAFQFVIICREWGRRLTLLVLFVAREAMILGRRLFGRAEQRFAKLINLVKGRGVDTSNNRGSVSFFLREIDEHKKQLGSSTSK